MKQIDLTKVSAHVILDREARFDMIEKTVGFGFPVIEVPDKKGSDCTATLTDTGVMVIIDPFGMIVTAWVASVRQAMSVWNRGTNYKRMPVRLWNMINYNNNTEMWQRVAA